MEKNQSAISKIKKNVIRGEKIPPKEWKLMIIRYIASKIYKHKLLKQIWNVKKLYYGQLLSINYWETFPDRDDYAPILVPEPGIPINDVSLSIMGKEIILETELRGKRTRNEKYITAAGVLIIQDPVEKLKYKFRIIPIQSEKLLIKNTRHLKLKTTFSRELMTTILGFRDRQIYLVLVVLDENGKPVNYSRQIKEYNLQRFL
jgi:hypothetical protein